MHFNNLHGAFIPTIVAPCVYLFTMAAIVYGLWTGMPFALYLQMATLLIVASCIAGLLATTTVQSVSIDEGISFHFPLHNHHFEWENLEHWIVKSKHKSEREAATLVFRFQCDGKNYSYTAKAPKDYLPHIKAHLRSRCEESPGNQEPINGYA